jgi:hypothetical protein
VTGGYLCDILLNVHSSIEDKSDDMKDSFYKELECVFYQFPRYHMKILFKNFNAKVRRGDILNQHLGMREYAKFVMVMGLE